MENQLWEAPIQDAAHIAILAEALAHEDIVCFDTEFMRESTFFPQLEILQFGTEHGTWLVDIAAFRRRGRETMLKELAPLFVVLQNPLILKIVHAAQGDQECLFTCFGIVASPTLDTDTAASVCGYGDSLGLGNMLKAVLNVSIQKGHARTDWAARPLPPQQIEYAHLDVKYLVVAGRKLLAELESKGRRESALK